MRELAAVFRALGEDEADGEVAARARERLARGVPDLEGDGLRVMDFGRGELAGVVVEAARLAVQTRRAGEDGLAGGLLALARRAQAAYDGRFGATDEPLPLHRFVAGRLAAWGRSAAFEEAHRGASRADLLTRWKALARLPFRGGRAEAAALAGHYRALLAEDAAWVEPDAARLAPAAQAAYWLHHLRDADARQRSDPGMCHVLAESGLGPRGDAARPGPAAELVKLGLAAVPLLVAHLDDPRPTRCLGHGRSFAPESYYLLRYGDCCQQIFEAVTGRTIYERSSTNGYPLKDGKARECKARAGRWWAGREDGP